MTTILADTPTESIRKEIKELEEEIVEIREYIALLRTFEKDIIAADARKLMKSDYKKEE